MRTLLIALAVLLFGAAANAAPSTPQDAVQAYFADLRTKGLSAGADHIHPAELARFRAMLLPLFGLNVGAQPNELRTAFFGPNATEESVSATPPREFMRSFLSRFMKEPGVASLQFQTPEVVGSVPEGDVVHLITRTRVSNGELAFIQLEVVSLKKDGDEWRLMLSGSIEGIAQAMRQRAGLK